MKLIDCAQGSSEWHNLRLGRPTASQYFRIITPGRMEFAKGADTYAHELLVDLLLGFSETLWDPREKWRQLAEHLGAYGSFSQRGEALEAEARAWYSFERDLEVEQPGFILRDDEKTGGSPDGFVPTGDSDGVGGVEIKCRKPGNHIGLLLGHADPASWTQVQGYMWITDAEWWDVLAYHGGKLPPVLIREYRDDEKIGKLAECVERFLEGLAEGQERLDELGMDGLRDSRGPLSAREDEELDALALQRIEEGLCDEAQALRMLVVRDRTILRWFRDPGTVEMPT